MISTARCALSVSPYWWQRVVINFSCRRPTVLLFRKPLYTFPSRQFSLAATTDANELDTQQESRQREPLSSRSVAELNKKTEELLVLVQQIGPSSQQDRRSVLRENDCFDVLEAWMELSKEGSGLYAASRAQKLLDALEQNLDNASRRTVFVPRASYHDVVLHAYAVSGGKREAAEAAQMLLERMLARCRSYIRRADRNRVLQPPEPTCQSFNIAMNCWAKSGCLDAGFRAEQLVQLMKTWRQECLSYRANDPSHPYKGCRPDVWSLSCTIDAWTRSRNADAPERALDILSRAVEQQRKESSLNPIELNVVVFNSVISTWVRNRRGREVAMKAEEILKMLVQLNESGQLRNSVQPDTRTYSMVLYAWAQCEKIERAGFAAQRAEEILSNMLKLYRDGLDVKPNFHCFTTCIAAWSRCKGVADAPERAEHLLDLLINLYEETGDEDFKPTTQTGNAVISAWSRAVDRPDSIKRAFASLEKLKSFSKADLISYSAVLDGMAKKGLGSDAMVLLDWLETTSTAGRSELRPNKIIYNTVLTALAKDTAPGSVYKAESLLLKMESEAASGRQNIKPDIHSYTAVMNAWAQSNDPSKALRAQTLLRALTKRYEAGEKSLKPSTIVFNVLMKACSQTRGTLADRRSALIVAFDALQALETTEFGPPDHLTFSTMMLAINFLSEDSAQRLELFQSVFQRCAASGNVSRDVLKFLSRGTNGQGPGPKDLHPDWSRNVPPRNRP